jgi:hypothetical protein
MYANRDIDLKLHACMYTRTINNGSKMLNIRKKTHYNCVNLTG